MRIETERLVLRLPRPADAEAAGELLGDPKATRFIGGPAPPEAWQTVVDRWCRGWEVNGVGKFVVERRGDGRFLGRVGINVWDTRTWRQTTLDAAGDAAQPELSWALVRAEWGQGYATEAARAVLGWAALGPLVSLIAPANVASARVAERLGAVPGETVELFDTGDAVIWRYAS
jgi:RimJ/RimL family protein N-acetyltransferase